MALSWDTTNIHDHENVCFYRRKPNPDERVEPEDLDENGECRYLSPITNALIWSTITVRIGQITERNAAEFYARLCFVEKVMGNSLLRTSQGYELSLTPQDVQAHIGLVCNVANEPRSKFLRSFDFDVDQYAKEYRQAVSTPQEGEAA